MTGAPSDGLVHPGFGAPADAPLLPRALLAVTFAIVAVLLAGRLWWLPARASLNVNEGWNALQAMRAFGAGPLYPAPDGLTANNYPPLSFFLVGGLGRLLGDDVLAGRLVAIVAEAAVGAAVFALVRRLAAGRVRAVAGVMLFALYAATLLRPYAAMNDPQWLAEALMAWGLVAATPARAGLPPATGRVVGAAALMVCAGLVKHNTLAPPLAVTLWLLLTDHRALAVWLVAAAGFAALACAGLYALWGRTVFADVAGAARSLSLVRMAAKGGPFLLAMAPGLLAAWPLWAARRSDPRGLLPLLLLVCAVPLGALQRAGDGVDLNACFEGVIAVAVAVPAAARGRSGPSGRWLALAALPAACLIPVAALADARELGGRDAAVARWRPFIADLAAAPGPVACDDQAVCYWAGRDSGLDFFLLKQRLLKGRSPPLEAALAARRFALVEMRGVNPGWHADRLRPAILARYRVVRRDGGDELLVAKP